MKHPLWRWLFIIVFAAMGWGLSRSWHREAEQDDVARGICTANGYPVMLHVNDIYYCHRRGPNGADEVVRLEAALWTER